MGRYEPSHGQAGPHQERPAPAWAVAEEGAGGRRLGQGGRQRRHTGQRGRRGGGPGRRQGRQDSCFAANAKAARTRASQRSAASQSSKAKVDAWRKDVAAKTRSDPEERREQNEKERRAKAAAKRGRKASPKSKAKRPSLLDLAAEVLAKAKEPLDCKTIVEKVLASGRWQTKGKTPEATLYSAITREISKKGNDARFEKVDRGQFQLAK